MVVLADRNTTGMLIIWAKLSDIFGRKHLVIVAVLVFTAFSGACGAAQSMTQLWVSHHTKTVHLPTRLIMVKQNYTTSFSRSWWRRKLRLRVRNSNGTCTTSILSKIHQFGICCIFILVAARSSNRWSSQLLFNLEMDLLVKVGVQLILIFWIKEASLI